MCASLGMIMIAKEGLRRREDGKSQDGKLVSQGKK